MANKEYYSDITIRISGWNLEAKNKEHYVELLKELFEEEHGILLLDNEIEIMECEL